MPSGPRLSQGLDESGRQAVQFPEHGSQKVRLVGNLTKSAGGKQSQFGPGPENRLTRSSSYLVSFFRDQRASLQSQSSNNTDTSVAETMILPPGG